MTTPPEPLASTVRAELARRRLTQTDAATHLRMLPQSLNDRLRGRTPFTLGELLALAAYLGVPAADLLPDTERHTTRTA